MRTNYEKLGYELSAKKQITGEIKTKVSNLIQNWISSAEESAKNNQPFNHQVLYKIKEDLNKLFDEELNKLH